MTATDKTQEMTVGVVGLGLIGGSVAKAYKAAGYRVLGADRDAKILGFARLAGVIDEVLEPETNLGKCDLVFLAAYPGAVIEYVKENAGRFNKDGLVMDCCGVKKAVCEACFPVAEEYGFTFVGGHPMAGTERSGLKVSRADLFQGGVHGGGPAGVRRHPSAGPGEGGAEAHGVCPVQNHPCRPS